MDDAERPRIVIDDARLAGVWANAVELAESEHEFTLDFLRFDHSESPPQQGILVARVVFSSPLMVSLIDGLSRSFARYAERAMPKEVRGDEVPPDQEG